MTKPMKSAYELAMERLGGGGREYTAEQKEKLAEIDRIYDAKAAQAKLSAQDRLKRAGNDPEARKKIADDLAVELASCEGIRELEKKKIRG